MKPLSKRASLLLLTFAVLYLIARYALCYWAGYHQTSWSVIGWQRLLIIPEKAVFLLVFISSLASVFQEKHRIWAAAILAGVLIFMGIPYVTPQPHDLILYGLRDGMTHDYRLDNMRRFARDFDQLPRLPHTLETYKLFYWNKDLNQTALKEKYPFLANCEACIEWDDRVNVDWGGFEDHWGFTAAVDGKKIDPQYLEPHNKIIRASDDILFQSDF